LCIGKTASYSNKLRVTTYVKYKIIIKYKKEMKEERVGE
jgi:hypothetical protein